MHEQQQSSSDEDDINSSFSLFSEPLDKDNQHTEESIQTFDADSSGAPTAVCSSGHEEIGSTCQVPCDLIASVEHHPQLQDDDLLFAEEHGLNKVKGCAKEDMRGSIDADGNKSTEEKHAGEDLLKHIGCDNGVYRASEGKPIVWSRFDQVGIDGVQSSLNSPCSSRQALLQQAFARTGSAIGLTAVS